MPERTSECPLLGVKRTSGWRALSFICVLSASRGHVDERAFHLLLNALHRASADAALPRDPCACPCRSAAAPGCAIRWRDRLSAIARLAGGTIHTERREWPPATSRRPGLSIISPSTRRRCSSRISSAMLEIAAPIFNDVEAFSSSKQAGRRSPAG